MFGCRAVGSSAARNGTDTAGAATRVGAKRQGEDEDADLPIHFGVSFNSLLVGGVFGLIDAVPLSVST